MNQGFGGRRGVANLPLHGGRAPAWLFRRMVELAGAITTVVAQEFGPEEMLRRLSDPFWFQAFGCVLGFDWHSSGLTTTVCGALKEAQKKFGSDMGIVVCGGKGGVSRKTPHEIEQACLRTGDPGDQLVYASRMSAKVDSAAVQDGYQLYQHTFIFVPGTPAAAKLESSSAAEPLPRAAEPMPLWCVIQQGMNDANGYARRYHWASDTVSCFVRDPHAAVASQGRASTLNLVASEGEANRVSAVELAKVHPDKLLNEAKPILRQKQLPLFRSVVDRAAPARTTPPVPAVDPGERTLSLPARHSLTEADIAPKQLRKVLIETYENPPADFEALLGRPGVGPSTLRSLALIAEVIFNAPASRRDPATYSFAHGGKDGHPFPVARQVYDENIERLKEVINAAKLGHSEKMESLARLSRWLDRGAHP